MTAVHLNLNNSPIALTNGALTFECKVVTANCRFSIFNTQMIMVKELLDLRPTLNGNESTRSHPRAISRIFIAAKGETHLPAAFTLPEVAFCAMVHKRSFQKNRMYLGFLRGLLQKRNKITLTKPPQSPIKSLHRDRGSSSTRLISPKISPAPASNLRSLEPSKFQPDQIQ